MGLFYWIKIHFFCIILFLRKVLHLLLLVNHLTEVKSPRNALLATSSISSISPYAFLRPDKASLYLFASSWTNKLHYIQWWIYVFTTR